MELSLLLSDLNLLVKENIDNYLKEKKIKLGYEIINTLIINNKSHIEIPSGIQFKTSKGNIQVFLNNSMKSMDQEFFNFNEDLKENTKGVFSLLNMNTKELMSIESEELLVNYLKNNSMKIKNKKQK